MEGLCGTELHAAKQRRKATRRMQPESRGEEGRRRSWSRGRHAAHFDRDGGGYKYSHHSISISISIFLGYATRWFWPHAKTRAPCCCPWDPMRCATECVLDRRIAWFKVLINQEIYNLPKTCELMARSSIRFVTTNGIVQSSDQSRDIYNLPTTTDLTPSCLTACSTKTKQALRFFILLHFTLFALAFQPLK